METVQYWKPGETRPTGPVDGGIGSGPSSEEQCVGDKTGERARKGGRSRGDHDESESSSNRRTSEGLEKREEKGKRKKRRHSSGSMGGVQAELARAASKPPVVGPSQGLLAMKFMQRKVKADEVQQQQQDKRDISSSFAKRLKPNKATDKDRLICQLDEQDPALVVVGRRSFGGFNVVAEAAYNACIRDIAAGERRERIQGEEDGEGGISDAEMAERLGKNVRYGGQR